MEEKKETIKKNNNEKKYWFNENKVYKIQNSQFFYMHTGIQS